MYAVMDNDTFIKALRSENRLVPRTIKHQSQGYTLKDGPDETSWLVARPDLTIASMCRVRRDSKVLLLFVWGRKALAEVLLTHVRSTVQFDLTRIQRQDIRKQLYGTPYTMSATTATATMANASVASATTPLVLEGGGSGNSSSSSGDTAMSV